MKGRWLAAPAVLVVAGLFVGGLALALFGSLPVSNYTAVLRSVAFRDSLLLTVWVAALSTAISAALGLLLALLLRNPAKGRSRPSAPLSSRRGGRRDPGFVLREVTQDGAAQTGALILNVPVVVPHLAFALAAIHLLAPGALIARALLALGLIGSQSDFPNLLHDRYGIGIVLVYVLKETPFLALLCLAVLLRIEGGYDDIARTLGASRLQRLRHVTLPLVGPSLAAGSALVFAFVFSAFEVPWLLGRTYPPMLGIMAQRKFMEGELSERPEALAIALLTALIATAVIAVVAIPGAYAGRHTQEGTGQRRAAQRGTNAAA